MRETITLERKPAQKRFYAQADAAADDKSAAFHFVSDSPERPPRLRAGRLTCAVCRATLERQPTRRGWTQLYCSNACRQIAKRHRSALRHPGPNAWLWRKSATGRMTWIVECADGRFRIEDDAGRTLATRRTYAGAYAAAAVAALDYRCIGFQPALCAGESDTK